MAELKNQTKESIKFTDSLGESHERETIEFTLERGYKVTIVRNEYEIDVTVYDVKRTDEDDVAECDE